MELHSDEHWMQAALDLAQQAGEANEVPVGAVVVLDNEIIGQAHNQPITLNDPTAHAELLALRQAAQHIQNYRLIDAQLYVTLEPCTMCVGAMVHARIKRLVFGATEPKAGVVTSQQTLLDSSYMNYKVQWQGGVLAEPCSQILSEFFARRREDKKRNR